MDIKSYLDYIIKKNLDMLDDILRQKKIFGYLRGGGGFLF